MRLGRISHLFIASALGLGLGVSVAMAGETVRPLGVVELFTSQGCSSCPPADAMLGELAQSDNVIALAYHVDYWDYLGWKDDLGSAENTARQRSYARSLDSSIYTPQAIINGRSHMNGARKDAVAGLLADMGTSDRGLSIDVSIEEADDSYIINTGQLADEAVPDPDAYVILVNYAPKQAVAIKSGENRGQTLEYWNAVTSTRTIGMWHGGAKSFELPKNEVISADDGGCAVLLQVMDKNGRPGPILGAARL